MFSTVFKFSVVLTTWAIATFVFVVTNDFYSSTSVVAIEKRRTISIVTVVVALLYTLLAFCTERLNIQPRLLFVLKIVEGFSFALFGLLNAIFLIFDKDDVVLAALVFGLIGGACFIMTKLTEMKGYQ